MGEFHVKNNNYEVVHCSEVEEEWSSMRGETLEFYLSQEGNSYQVWGTKSKVKDELVLPLILHRDCVTLNQKRNGTKMLQGHISFHDGKEEREESCQEAADNEQTIHSRDKHVHAV